ncbi:uncharacterized protein LOC131229419 isoform X2 [Magnolia sinica]|uniref:uncharacterized protein LOC131229419 isoform X2 n=1 Tax=Magnolia sinica TaxID=86752 RepID=UPI002658B600|nr:uncharacterized protein LOC131229419 isoform X2 [Magnolia sinica]
MEKKKEEKLTQKNQEIESHEYLKQTGVDRLRKNSKVGSPPHDAVSSQAQQYIPTLQWPYTPQPSTVEHTLSRQLLNTQQNSPAILNQRQAPLLNPQQQQPNSINHHHQHGQLQVTPSLGAYWLPPRPGFQAALTPYQPLAPAGTTDSSWQAPVVVGASSGSESISTYGYQGGYYPMGFPGPWYPPSLWGQPQQPQPPYSLHYPACTGGYDHFAVPPPASESLSFGQPHQRGIMQLQAKLSQKHQRIWEAQSAENVHLRTALCRVEAELATHRSKLLKLEAEVSSLKTQRDSAAEGSARAGAIPAVQTSKRGRPKRPIASVSSLPFTDDLQPKTRGRKPASCKVETEIKGLIPEKESLNKEEDRAKACQPVLGIGPASFQGETDGKISNTFVNGCPSELCGSKLKLSPDVQTIPTFQNQVHYSPRVQISPVSLTPAVEMKGQDDKEECRKTAFSIPSQHIKGADAAGTSNGNHAWQSNILSEDIRSHAFYDGANIIRQGGKLFSGWSFVNQDASEEPEDVVGSGKDDDEMEEDVSSAADEMSQAKAEGGFGMDPSAVTSNRW